MLTVLALFIACNPIGHLTGDVRAKPLEPAQASFLKAPIPLTQAPEFQELLAALSAAESRQEVLSELATRGEASVPLLRDVALHHTDLPTRGWAIHALGELPGQASGSALEEIQYAEVPGVVQAWAGAARIQRADELYELLALADTATALPALLRPLKLQAELLADQLEDVGQALEAMATGPSVVQQVLAPVLLGRGPGELILPLFRHPNPEARRLAAGLLGSMERQQPGVGSVVAAAYAPDSTSTEVRWAGGPLYVPALNWRKSDAQVLVGHLISWQVFCEEQGLTAEINQIRNNLNSLQLLDPAGFGGQEDWPESDTVDLVRQWGRIHGELAQLEVLRPWGLEASAKYAGRTP